MGNLYKRKRYFKKKKTYARKVVATAKHIPFGETKYQKGEKTFMGEYNKLKTVLVGSLVLSFTGGSLNGIVWQFDSTHSFTGIMPFSQIIQDNITNIPNTFGTSLLQYSYGRIYGVSISLQSCINPTWLGSSNTISSIPEIIITPDQFVTLQSGFPAGYPITDFYSGNTSRNPIALRFSPSTGSSYKASRYWRFPNIMPAQVFTVSGVNYCYAASGSYFPTWNYWNAGTAGTNLPVIGGGLLASNTAFNTVGSPSGLFPIANFEIIIYADQFQKTTNSNFAIGKTIKNNMEDYVEDDTDLVSIKKSDINKLLLKK